MWTITRSIYMALSIKAVLNGLLSYHQHMFLYLCFGDAWYFVALEFVNGISYKAKLNVACISLYSGICALMFLHKTIFI